MSKIKTGMWLALYKIRKVKKMITGGEVWPLNNLKSAHCFFKGKRRNFESIFG